MAVEDTAGGCGFSGRNGRRCIPATAGETRCAFHSKGTISHSITDPAECLHHDAALTHACPSSEPRSLQGGDSSFLAEPPHIQNRGHNTRLTGETLRPITPPAHAVRETARPAKFVRNFPHLRDIFCGKKGPELEGCAWVSSCPLR